MRILCTFLFFLFGYIILLYTGFVTFYLWHTLLLFSYIYIWWCMLFFSYLSMCCFFLLFIHMFLYVYNLYFCFTLRCLDEFCLKCFKKTGCENLSCNELSFCKVFQEFVLGLDIYIYIYIGIPTSGYEFSDLKFLTWFICLLWLCHRLPKGEIVRTYVRIVRDICYVNWLILWQNVLYL